MWTGIKYQSTQFYSCLGKRSSERPPEKSSCSVTELVSCSHLVPSFTVGSAWKTNENCTERMYIDVDVNTRLLIISFTILTCLDIGVGLQGRAGPCLQIEKDVLFPPYCQSVLYPLIPKHDKVHLVHCVPFFRPSTPTLFSSQLKIYFWNIW